MSEKLTSKFEDSPARFHTFLPNCIKIPLPDVTQKTGYSCGAVSLEAILHYYGACWAEEAEVVKALTMDHRVGANPHQLVDLAKRFGLRAELHERISLSELKHMLDVRHPVMLAIQAYGCRKNQLANYATSWDDGHWVIAIGYDHKGFIFEDPSLQACRGYLDDDELLTRWHDLGEHNVHLERLAIELWTESGQDSYRSNAKYIL